MSLALELKARYVKEEYVKKTPDVQRLTFHYLLALNQPDKIIIPYIERQRDRTQIVACDKKCFKWTPLIVATILNRPEVVNALLTTNASSTINHADSYSWTALHHAAAVSNAIFATLVQNGANTLLQTQMFATPRDIQLLTHRTSEPDPQIEQSTLLSSERLHELFQMSLWRTTPFYPPECIKILWQADPNEREPLEFLKQAFANFKQHPPILHIQKEPHLENHWGLFAGEDIEEGCVVSEYTGICVTPRVSLPPRTTLLQRMALDKESFSYYLKPYNAQSVGNACRFANFGWPNAYMDSVVSAGATRCILVAGEKISKNSPIYWDYGLRSFEVTLGVQQILGETEMLQYYKNGLKSALPELNSISAIAIQRIFFPINCPVALIKLHLKGYVLANEWKILLTNLDENELFKDWCMQNQDMSQLIRSIIARVIEFDTFLQTHKNPNVMKTWVENAIGKLTLLQILKGMELICSGSHDLHEVQLQIATYDPLTDDNGPLSVKRRAGDYLKLITSFYSPQKAIEVIMQQKAQVIDDPLASDTLELFSHALEKLSLDSKG